MVKTCDVRDFDRAMIVGVWQGGLSISGTADRQGFVHKRGQRRRIRLSKAYMKVTVQQITTHYNSGMQKSISEDTINQTSKCIAQQQK